MRKIILLVVSVLNAIIITAQIPNFQWGSLIAPDYFSTPFDIAYDSQKNVYVCGYFSGPSVDFDPGPGTFTLSAGANGRDVFITKMDSTGKFIWAKRMGGAGEDWGMAIYVDSLDNIYTAGTFQQNADFDPGPGTAMLSSPQSTTSVFVSKLDQNGDFVWARGVENVAFSTFDEDHHGNLVVVGSFIGTTDFDPGSGIFNLTSNGSTRSMYILKLSNAGNFVSALSSDNQATQGYVVPYQLKVDNSGSRYIIGTCGGTVDFDPGPAVNTQTVIGNNAIYLLKLDSSNNFQWARIFGGVNGYNEGMSLDVDKFGNVYATGHYAGTVDFDPGPGVYNLVTSGYSDAFILKLNKFGDLIWAKRTGGNGECQGARVKLDRMGGVNVVGYFNLDCDFDPGPGLNMPSTPSISDSDGYIMKLDSSGNFIWVGRIVGSSSDQCLNIAIDKRSNIYVVGTGGGRPWNNPNSITGMDLDPTGGVFPTRSLYDKTPFVIRIGACPSSVSAISGATSLCSGVTGTYSIVASTGATGYVWGINPGSSINSGQNTTSVGITFGNAPTHSIIVTPTNSCGSGNPGVLTVSINPTPTLTVNSGSICSGQSFTMNPSGALSYTYSSGSATVSPAVNATYTVTGTNSNGCTANAISSVTVSPTPTITVNSGTICSHETFTITPTGAATYTYSSGSNTVTPTTNSTYTITGTDVNGCVSTTGAISTLSVNAVPSLTATSNASVCVGTSTVLNVSGTANAYFWSIGATTASISVSPVITTTYTVTGIGINNCSATQTVAVTVNPNCQDLWPGDANSDGVADNLDILELGLHFTQSGPARATVSNSWQSYFANNWAGTISSGKNMNHSDCNGDGIIDANDTLAIFNNYGLTHAFKPAEPTTINPQLSIVPDQNMVAKGDWGTASVFLGEASSPITNINGLAFTVAFDQNLIDANNFYIEYPVSFLNTGNQNLKFQKSDAANGKLYTATTHKNNVNVTGYGKIAVLHYKIKSNLATDEVLNLDIAQSKQSNASGVLTPITAGTATLAAIGASVGIDELSNGNSIALYPNPANTSATIQSSGLLQKVEVLSLTGQIILSETASGTQHQLDLSNVAIGVYFVAVYSAGQKVSRKKLVVQR